MLSGRRALQECLNPSSQRACPRFLSLYTRQRNTFVAEHVLRLQTVTRANATLLKYAGSPSRTKGCLASFSVVRVAHLSTTSKISARPSKYESRFLKPHGKPKFRQRTKEESQEISKALSEAEAQYKSQLSEYPETHSERIVLESSASFTSPYFATAEDDVSNSIQSPVPQQRSNQHSSSSNNTSQTTYRSRKEASTSDLEDELYYLAHNDPSPIAIHAILKILVHDRKIRPAHNYYEALILANTWPEYGSVKNIETILSEMDTEDVEIGANIIAAVLKVLAIHPSPELANKMLAMAERRWIQLSPQTSHHHIASMIRTGQTELATFTLDVLRKNSKQIRSWDREVIPDYLVVLLLVEMVKINDWEGVLRYVYKLRNRRATDREIPVIFWGWLLEMASKAARQVSEVQFPPSATSNVRHDNTNTNSNQESNQRSQSPPNLIIQRKSTPTSLSSTTQTQIDLSNPAKWLTEYLWTFYVAPMSMRPSWSTCLNILHTAANIGTVWLAESVFATMTYLNGIDSHGKPKAKIDADTAQLVETAKERARAALGDEYHEREQAARDGELRRAAQKVEDDEWWEQVFRLLRDEEESVGSDNRSMDEGNGKVKVDEKEDEKEHATMSPAEFPRTQEEVSQTFDRDGVDNTIADIDIDNETPTPIPIPDTDTSNDNKDSHGTFQPFDPKTAPPGNLWPLFPSIGDLDSARVDPWDALGPRSAARRKWTEAQERFKMGDRQKRKKY